METSLNGGYLPGRSTQSGRSFSRSHPGVACGSLLSVWAQAIGRSQAPLASGFDPLTCSGNLTRLVWMHVASAKKCPFWHSRLLRILAGILSYMYCFHNFWLELFTKKKEEVYN